VVTVPLPAFQAPPAPEPEAYRCAFERCAGKVSRLLALVEDAGRRLALEIMPGAVIGGTDGFLRLCDHLCADTLGFNFDTGRAWACKENVYVIPAKLEDRILGTHLCDNVGHENLSLCPGAGSIDWPHTPFHFANVDPTWDAYLRERLRRLPNGPSRLWVLTVGEAGWVCQSQFVCEDMTRPRQ
jgi:sugar phosphate isomerase/epimerase